jgi:cysteine synthase
MLQTKTAFLPSGFTQRLDKFLHDNVKAAADLMQPFPKFASEIGAAEVWGFMGKYLPAGSTKSVAALGMVEFEAMQGKLAGCKRFVLSTSANTGIAKCHIGARLGIPVTTVIDSRISPGKLAELKRLGADIVMVDKPHPTGGFVQARIEMARRIAAETDGALDVDQYNNPGAPLAHYTYTGRLIWERLRGRIDVVAAAISTGATAAGIFHRIRDYDSRVATLAVDCEGSILTGRPAGPHLLTGIGAQIISDNMRIAYSAIAGLPPAVISDADAFRECHRILASDGEYVGGSAGAVFAAIRALGARAHGKRIVAILADGGEAYEETIFNHAWLAAKQININNSESSLHTT